MSKKSISGSTEQNEKQGNLTTMILRVIAVLGGLLFLGWMFVNNYILQPTMYETKGSTMGTKYYIRVFANSGWRWDNTIIDVQKELDRIDQMMTTYDSESEVSKFNASKSTDWFPVSAEVVEVVKLSKEVSAIVDRKFDITMGPVVDIWGFGSKKKKLIMPPAPGDIASVLMHTGLNKLEYQENPPALRKTDADLHIDLSGVAKGYAVDRIAVILESCGYKNYTIEVGGEVQTKGIKHENKPWVIGIKEPIPLELFSDPVVYQTVLLNGKCLATSGDDQNSVTIGDKDYTHIIDPSTGNAIVTEFNPDPEGPPQLGSVSVIAGDCARADALATGFFILGVERGIQLADANKIPVIYLLRTGNPKKPVTSVMSAEFEKLYYTSENEGKH